MNYTTITINGKTVGLKFGMLSNRIIAEKAAKLGDVENEMGVASVIYAGYMNNIAVKEVLSEFTFEDIVDFVEVSSKTDDVKQINDVIDFWSKTLHQETTEEKKKVSRGKK